MIKWKIETKKIKDLKSHPKNPRQISKKQNQHLKESIAKFGLIDKPIISHDNVIIGGHQRIKALKYLGHLEVECLVPEIPLSEQEINELNIRLNRVHGDFDYDILANEWNEIELLEWGFSEEELIGIRDDDEKGKIEKTKSKKKITCPNCLYEFEQ